MTPLQMAEVAATVANNGELMEPRLWSTGDRPRRRAMTESSIRPSTSQLMSEETAVAAQHDDAERGQRRNRDQRGDPSGIDVAGKTGTAEISTGVNDAWFIGFAPADDPQIAIACIVEHTERLRRPTCGPIFKAVAEVDPPAERSGWLHACSEQGTVVDERYRL